MTCLVLVPVRESSAARLIASKSGVVEDGERFIAYFEGNLYGAVNLTSYEERLRCAVGRLVNKYPTIACGRWPRAEFVIVGEYRVSDDFVEHEIVVTDRATLDQWVKGA